MAAAQHRHVELVAEREQLVPELVDLRDRAPEVALLDLVRRSCATGTLDGRAPRFVLSGRSSALAIV